MQFFFLLSPLSLSLSLSTIKKNQTRERKNPITYFSHGALVAPTSETTAFPAGGGAAEGPRTVSGLAVMAPASAAALAPPSSPAKVAETRRTSLEAAGTVGAGTAVALGEGVGVATAGFVVAGGVVVAEGGFVVAGGVVVEGGFVVAGGVVVVAGGAVVVAGGVVVVGGGVCYNSKGERGGANERERERERERGTKKGGSEHFFWKKTKSGKKLSALAPLKGKKTFSLSPARGSAAARSSAAASEPASAGSE